MNSYLKCVVCGEAVPFGVAGHSCDVMTKATNSSYTMTEDPAQDQKGPKIWHVSEFNCADCFCEWVASPDRPINTYPPSKQLELVEYSAYLALQSLNTELEKEVEDFKKANLKLMARLANFEEGFMAVEVSDLFGLSELEKQLLIANANSTELVEAIQRLRVALTQINEPQHDNKGKLLTDAEALDEIEFIANEALASTDKYKV